MPYDWAGSRILQSRTSVHAKRYVLGAQDTSVATDLREFVGTGSEEEIRMVIRGLQSLPTTKEPGTFDTRAQLVWRWVVENVTYTEDPVSQLKQDFWQFPAETLALEKGDCEDCSFLLGTLLLATGISPFCVRVVWGKVKIEANGPYIGHIWPVYKDEQGIWRILESTLEPEDYDGVWPAADSCAKAGALPRYRPEICLNRNHVWMVRGGDVDTARYVMTHRLERKRVRKGPKRGRMRPAKSRK